MRINKRVLLLVVISVVCGLAIALFGSKKQDGQVQVINTEPSAVIKVKAGYKPNEVVLPAGKPSILRFETNDTYDCSASLYIGEFHIERFLPPNGITDIEIPAQPKGKEVIAGCAMGMYSFKIKFQ